MKVILLTLGDASSRLSLKMLQPCLNTVLSRLAIRRVLFENVLGREQGK